MSIVRKLAAGAFRQAPRSRNLCAVLASIFALARQRNAGAPKCDNSRNSIGGPSAIPARGFEFSWRPFQGTTHNLRLARNDCEVGARGGVRLAAALFPIAQRTYRNMVARREFLLRKAERASQ